MDGSALPQHRSGVEDEQAAGEDYRAAEQHPEVGRSPKTKEPASGARTIWPEVTGPIGGAGAAAARGAGAGGRTAERADGVDRDHPGPVPAQAGGAGRCGLVSA